MFATVTVLASTRAQHADTQTEVSAPADAPVAAERSAKRIWINRLRTWAVVPGVITAAAISVLALAGWTLSRAAPTWWRQINRADASITERAELIEQDAANRLYRIRPAAPGAPADEAYRSSEWSVALSDDDASAWLTSRLPKWLAGQEDLPTWPSDFSQLQVRFEGGLVRVGIRHSGEGDPRVYSAAFTPRIDDDGAIWLDTDSVKIGRLPVPSGWIIADARARLADEGDETNAGFFAILAGDAPVAHNPVIRLDEARQVRLMDLAVRDGKLVLTCRTEGRLARR